MRIAFTNTLAPVCGYRAGQACAPSNGSACWRGLRRRLDTLLVNPLAGLALDLEGTDSHQTMIPRSPG